MVVVMKRNEELNGIKIDYGSRMRDEKFRDEK